MLLAIGVFVVFCVLWLNIVLIYYAYVSVYIVGVCGGVYLYVSHFLHGKVLGLRPLTP